MKIIALLVAILFYDLSYSQYALISDKDGYSNVRADTGLGGKIKDTLHNDHLVYSLDPGPRWTSIEYSTGKHQYINGYIFHDRLKPIANFENIPRISRDTCLFGKDSITVEVTTQPFIKSKYRLTYVKGGLQLINGKKFFGTDGEIPTRGYKSIVVKLGGREIILPKAAIENLYQPSLHHTQVHLDRQKDIIYITASNSDGAGFYDVVWKIEKGVYTDRHITNGL